MKVCKKCGKECWDVEDVCPDCGYSFTQHQNYNSYNEYKNENLNEIVICPHCGSTFVQNQSGNYDKPIRNYDQYPNYNYNPKPIQNYNYNQNNNYGNNPNYNYGNNPNYNYNPKPIQNYDYNQNYNYNYKQESNSNKTERNDSCKTAAKIFMLIGTILMSLCLYLIPLAWCIPMTVYYWNKVKNNEPVGTAFKICSLLFVSLLAGIFMLIDKD